MDNLVPVILIVGAVCTVLFTLGGVFNLRKMDSNRVKESDILMGIGNHVWSYLTLPQQEELSNMKLLYKQEEWLESHVTNEVLKGLPAEKVLVELANRGFISLGHGTFKRQMTAMDFIEHESSNSDNAKAVKSEDKVEHTSPRLRSDSPKSGKIVRTRYKVRRTRRKRG